MPFSFSSRASSLFLAKSSVRAAYFTKQNSYKFAEARLLVLLLEFGLGGFPGVLLYCHLAGFRTTASAEIMKQRFSIHFITTTIDNSTLEFTYVARQLVDSLHQCGLAGAARLDISPW